MLAVLLVSSRWGLLVRGADRGAERAGVQLLPHPSDGAVQHRRGRELGGTRGVRGRRAGHEHPVRHRSGPRRRGGARPAGGGPDRRDGTPAARRRQHRGVAAEPSPSGSRRRTSFRPSRWSWHGSTAIPAGARCRSSWTGTGSGPCWCRQPSTPSCLDALQDRVVPALETLVGAARRRDELEAQVIETKALRRSNVVKTTLLRTVSHDLRSPLTAITAAAGGLASPNLDERAAPRTDLRDQRRERATVAVGGQPARPDRAFRRAAPNLGPTGARSRSWSRAPSSRSAAPPGGFDVEAGSGPAADPGGRRPARASVRERARELRPLRRVGAGGGTRPPRRDAS